MMLMIDFSWGQGRMFVNAEALIREIPMQKYRKWVKMFAQYGKPDDHEAFLQMLEERIRIADDYVSECRVTVKEWEMKYDRLIPTNFTRRHCAGQLRLAHKHLSGANSRLKRYQTMEDLLKGLLS